MFVVLNKCVFLQCISHDSKSITVGATYSPRHNEGFFNALFK